jgi:hypothetical protein
MKKNRRRKPVKIPHYKVDYTKTLGHNHLITAFLKNLDILEKAKGHLREIYYFTEDNNGVRKNYFGAGCQNELGSWEVRNKYFKGCLGTKGIIFFPGHQKNLLVYDDFIDYLKAPVTDSGVIIICGQLAAAIAKAKAFSDITLYVENRNLTRDFIKALPYATDKFLSLNHAANGKF